MANGTRVKIITGVVILLAAAFVLLAFYMIPRIYNLSASVDFTAGDGVYENPLMGYVNWARHPEEAQTGQLVYIDVTWAEWEPREGHFDIKGLEERNHIKRWKDEGKHAVLRFVCDMPGSEKHMDIPQWLYEKQPTAYSMIRIMERDTHRFTIILNFWRRTGKPWLRWAATAVRIPLFPMCSWEASGTGGNGTQSMRMAYRPCRTQRYAGSMPASMQTALYMPGFSCAGTM